MAAKVRASWVLGAAVVAAGAWMIPTGGAVATRVEGGALAPRSQALSASTARPGGELPVKALPGLPPELPPTLTGDAALAGQVDLARAELVGDHYEVPLAAGRRAVLTLDPRLQASAEKALARSKAPRGAVVVLDMDGRVLALAGRRTAGPEGGTDATPDWHLATTAWAPAASVFKLVTASALLEAGVTPSTKVCYHGGVRSVVASNLIDGRRDNRCQDLTYAVAYSQNAIVAKLAHQHLEPKALAAMARTLGVDGDLPGFALPGAAGEADVPPTNDLDFAKTAAGFENSHLSPMGGALLADTIATRGLAVTPHLVDAVIDGGRRTSVVGAAPRRALPEGVAARVGRMMEQTCVRGTARKAFHGRHRELPGGVRAAGKTGTLSRSKPFYLEYSWFVGYAPADHPKVAIAVALGNAELWWLKGHQVAQMVLRDAVTDPPDGGADDGKARRRADRKPAR